jgi:hypothetical protein
MNNIRAGYDTLSSHCLVDSNELNQLASQLKPVECTDLLRDWVIKQPMY